MAAAVLVFFAAVAADFKGALALTAAALDVTEVLEEVPRVAAFAVGFAERAAVADFPPVLVAAVEAARDDDARPVAFAVDDFAFTEVVFF